MGAWGVTWVGGGVRRLLWAGEWGDRAGGCWGNYGTGVIRGFFKKGYSEAKPEGVCQCF